MGRRRTDRERDRDLRETTERALAGELQVDIARALGLSQQQISRDLERARRVWEEKAQQDFAQMRQEELARLRELERAAWEGWEHSLEPREVTHLRRRKGRALVSEVVVRSETRDGSSRYLRLILGLLGSRGRLLKLSGPPWDHSLAHAKWVERVLEDMEQLARVGDDALVEEINRRYAGGIRVWLGARASPEERKDSRLVFLYARDEE